MVQGLGGEAQVLIAGSFLLTAYSAETGEKIWWVGGLSFEMKSTPVLNDKAVFINGYGSPLNQPGRQLSIPSFSEVLESDSPGSLSSKSAAITSSPGSASE